MNDALSVFAPLQDPKKRIIQTMLITQVVMLALLWFASPFAWLPQPGEAISALNEQVGQGVIVELGVSFWLNLQAIGIAAVVSLLLAVSTVVPFCRPVVATFSKLRFLSMAGLSYFFAMMTHGGHELKLSLLVFSVSVFFVTSMADVIAKIPKEQFDLARTLRMGPWRVVSEVVVLGQFDKAFECLRQNAAIGWMMLTMVESTVRSEGGIGTVLMDQNKHFRIAAVFAIQVIIFSVGMLQDYGIGWLRNIVCPYADLTLERK